MPYENLEYHKVNFPSEGVLHVEINRPKVLNAMHAPTWQEYGRIMREAGSDPEVRVVVVNGVGRAFCAGLDVAGSIPEMAERSTLEASRKGIALAQYIRDFQRDISAPYFINKPVIGVAHGPAIGLALDILTAVDIRFASRDTIFSVREVEIGMTADIGTLQRLPKIVGDIGWVKDVSFTGRNFSAGEAKLKGLVLDTFDTKEQAIEHALQYASTVAQKSPVAVFGVKKSINYAVDHTHEDALNQIAEYNAYALGEDFVNGAMNFRNKEKPKYPNLPKL